MMEPERPAFSPEDRRKILRAAALRPLHVLTLVAGLGIFFTTLAWWVLPLTLATYTAVVYLAYRDPLFGRRAIEGRRAPPQAAPESRDLTPERRARWLPRGETRRRVEEALVTYRKVVAAIEESDDVTRAVLDDAVPKLHAAANRLVGVAHNREKAAQAGRELRDRASSSQRNLREAEDIEAHVREADAEISGISEKLLTLRAQVVRASIDAAGASQQAASLNASLDELNVRLEALNETMSPPGEIERGH